MARSDNIDTCHFETSVFANPGHQQVALAEPFRLEGFVAEKVRHDDLVFTVLSKQIGELLGVVASSAVRSRRINNHENITTYWKPKIS